MRRRTSNLSPDDPQPNPRNDKAAIHFVSKRSTPEEEITAVVDSIGKWLPQNGDDRRCVGARNLRGVDVINALKAKGIEHVEFLSSTSNTRAAAGALSNSISYLADPQSASKLSKPTRSGGGTGAMAEDRRRNPQRTGRRLPRREKRSSP